MPHTTQTSDFWGWYLRHNSRTVWSNLQDAGIDVFSVGPSNNTQAFLDLYNVVPAVSGGFNRRWGTSYLTKDTSVTSSPQIVRTFLYNFPQDTNNPSTTANTDLFIATDNQNFYTYTDAGVAFGGYKPTNFASAGEVGAVSSRGYFYYGNGVNAPRKVNPSVTTPDTDSLLGIQYPSDNIIPTPNPYVSCLGAGLGIPGLPSQLYGQSTGYGYLTAPSVTITDPTGSGSGAAISLTLGVNGEVINAVITSSGSGYQQANATVAAPPSGGTQAYLVLYVQVNSAAPRYGEVVGVDFGGQMSFVSGRQYTLAFQNSQTGHTSDTPITGLEQSFSTGRILNQLTSAYGTGVNLVTSEIPIYIASSNVTAGYTQNELLLQFPASGLDPQIDTIILLATSDGGGTGTLYQVASIPLASMVLDSGYYYYYYKDTLPDSYNDQNNSGDTLLEADIWAYTDPSGQSFGITLNTPPTASGFLYPTYHQGRLFATDGKTLFYSKSIDEVTTSTGLITSKWEECWPGDYQLPIASGNEQILGMKSDGTNLHVGTDKSIYTVYGSDPSSFSIPAQSFAQTGILSNDCWTVIFSEGQPAGFAWITKDFKVMHSDFATYREIGTPILPWLQTTNLGRIDSMKVLSLTQGPYNFVYIYYFPQSGSLPEFLIWETRLQKWYRWSIPAPYAGAIGVSNVTMTSSGNGYSGGLPTVSFSGGGGTGAAGSAYWTVSHDGVAGVFITHSGSGYLTAPTVVFTGGSGSGAAATASIGPVGGPVAALSPFVYQFPSYTSSPYSTGQRYLFLWGTSSSELDLIYYDPTQLGDADGSFIKWFVRTSWQDLGDPTSIKVINEVDITGTDVPFYVTLYGASSQSQFNGNGVTLKSSSTVTGPIASLQSNKLYCAGTPTSAKYFSVEIGPNVLSTIQTVLTSFSLEAYPMARI